MDDHDHPTTNEARNLTLAAAKVGATRDRLPPVDERLHDVCCAFAEHFLDTETRHDLPRAALVAVEAGLSVDDARRVWHEDVSAAVGANLLSVAGEWAGWDREWLCRRIEAIRAARARWPHWLRWLARGTSRLQIDGGATLRSVVGCMALLGPLPTEERRRLASDLAFLGSHYFDFCPPQIPPEPARRAALARCFDDVFLPIFRPLVLPCVEERSGPREARIRARLKG